MILFQKLSYDTAISNKEGDWCAPEMVVPSHAGGMEGKRTIYAGGKRPT